MERFEALQEIDSFCRVNVKKPAGDVAEQTESSNKEIIPERKLAGARGLFTRMPNVEDPLVDVIDEDDYVRILVQCRCREQEVTFHPCSDGIIVCKEERKREADGAEACENVCSKVSLPTDQLQLQDMLFIVAKCNNNNTLEATDPKIRR